MTTSSPPKRSALAFLALLVLAVPAIPATPLLGDDWPAYRADAARTGYTEASLPEGLALLWARDAGRPMPAWPRSERLAFDRAYAAVVAGGRLFYGSSRDHALHRLDANSGEGGPLFVTGGPIRFAPALWRDRLFVASDDGFLYCLDFEGEVIWKHRGGPGDARRLGNERLVSQWPARGAPVVVGDTVYYAAGIWPSDEIFLHALDCATGETRWVNDDSGGIYMPQPHGGADAESGVAAQGYLVVSGPGASNVPFPPVAPAALAGPGEAGQTPAAPQLLIPTGRAVPASFDLGSGAFQYFHLQEYGKRGGFATMALGPMFLNSGIAFDLESGKAGETVGAGPVAAFPEGLVRASGERVEAQRWVAGETLDRRGRPERTWELESIWRQDLGSKATSLVVAGGTVVAGGADGLFLLDLASGELLAGFPVEGEVHDLAVAGGKLFASTDAGRWYAFGDASAIPGGVARRHELGSGGSGDSKESAWPRDPAAVAAAEAILADPARRLGYCLDFGSGEAQLARELAERSDLHIYAVDDDLERVRRSRERLLRAGLYGSRVTVHHIEDLANLPHPRYFANLVVSGRSLSEPGAAFLEAGWQDCLRPYGGLALFGPAESLRETERGPLAGAGEWTHQYMDAANQLSSADEIVRGPLGMLWFRDVEIEVPQRHGRAPSPLFYDGLLYHLGNDELVCVDAYNGTERWRYPLPGILTAYDGDELMGASGTGSNFCVGETGLYVRDEGHCLRIDRRTGELLGRFEAPRQADGEPGTWGYIALAEGRLFGSLANTGHQVTFRWRESTGDMSKQFTESSALFAMDPVEGELVWRYDAKHSIRHNAIAIGDGQVFLVDRALALFDRRREAPAEPLPGGILLSLDAASGEERWRGAEPVEATTLAFSPEYRKLLACFQPTRFALASESGTRLAVYDSDKGDLQWEKDARYQTRPLINAYTIYAQGGAWDLLSGEERPFNFSRSYGCGVLAGSRHLMVYRSATLGYFDLEKNERTENFGGVRPGCWINALPAGGLVLVPDASAGCTCSYLNQSWMALEPIDLRPPTAEPAGGGFPGAVRVSLRHESPGEGAVIRYTLDGSSPGEDSPLYEGPVEIGASARLRSRVFAPDGRVSRAFDTSYLVDPALVPFDESEWRVWDVPGRASGAPSRWFVSEGSLHQTSNIYLGSATDEDPATERYATLYIHGAGDPVGDGVVEFEFRSGDDDGVGIAFRFQDESQHYLWATDLQRSFRVLALKDGEEYRVLAKNDLTYQRNVWQHVRIELEGARLRITVDGEEDFAVEDDRFREGGIAFHCWGSDRVEFRKLRVERKE